MAAIISFEPQWITLSRAHILLLQRLLFFIRPSDAINSLEPYGPDCAFTDIVANAKYPSVITVIMVKGGENQFCVLTALHIFKKNQEDFSFSMTDYFQTDDFFFFFHREIKGRLQKRKKRPWKKGKGVEFESFSWSAEFQPAHLLPFSSGCVAFSECWTATDA